MRVLLCNKFYYRRGGDCVYTMQLEQLLLSHGHQVAVFAMDHPDTADTPWRRYFPDEVNFDTKASQVRFAARSLGFGPTASRFKALLADFRPDVVHLGNIHSQLSPIIAQIAHRQGCKVVWTLHDYKLLCPRYDCLLHGAQPCELCFSDKRNVVRNRYMKDSLAGSIAAWMESVRWRRGRLERYTDAFICPSRFMLSKMEQGGFSSAKLNYLCNFFDAVRCEVVEDSAREDYYCYVGRLSAEKGIRRLAEVAGHLPWKLVVVGDGPLQSLLPEASNIVYTGRKDAESVHKIVRNARFTVIPSEWYENSPLSVIESLCLGTPVLGADIGGIPELIDAGRTGLLFKSGSIDDLAQKIEEMFAKHFNYDDIADASRRRFSPESYYSSLMWLYSKQGGVA